MVEEDLGLIIDRSDHGDWACDLPQVVFRSFLCAPATNGGITRFGGTAAGEREHVKRRML